MLQTLTKLGKWFFIIPFLAFGSMHLMRGGDMAMMVPSWLPGGVAWVYITGLCEVGFALSVVLGKLDKLAGILVALLLLIYVLTIHLPGLSNEAMKQMAMMSLLKDLGLMGGALMFAGAYAKDSSVVG